MRFFTLCALLLAMAFYLTACANGGQGEEGAVADSDGDEGHPAIADAVVSGVASKGAIANAAVLAYVGGRRVADTVTDERGGFRLVIPGTVFTSSSCGSVPRACMKSTRPQPEQPSVSNADSASSA